MILIDADKLKANLEKAISKNEDMDCLDFLRVASVIDAQPTAYDQKKVVKQLEKLLSDESFEKATKSVNESYYEGLLYAYGEAIEIVKAGGADAEH